MKRLYEQWFRTKHMGTCICFDGVVIAAQCTATLLRTIVLPRISVLLGREYAD